MNFYVKWFLIIVLTVVLLDELSYWYWRRMNRGEHWSHLTEKTGLQNWDEEPMEDVQLNRSWSGRF